MVLNVLSPGSIVLLGGAERNWNRSKNKQTTINYESLTQKAPGTAAQFLPKKQSRKVVHISDYSFP